MNRSLQAKSAARLAAAQLLYQAAITGREIRPDKLLDEYREYLEDDPAPVAPSAAHLKKLLEGIAAHDEALKPAVDSCLTPEWRRERVSPLLLAILTLGVFELAHLRDTKTPVIISEYVSLAARFFGEAETGFVNAALKGAAKELRDA